MKGFTRRIGCVLGAVLYLTGAILCAVSGFAVVITTELSHGQKAFVALVFIIMGITLGCVGLGKLRRAWRKNGGEEEENG